MRDRHGARPRGAGGRSRIAAYDYKLVRVSLTLLPFVPTRADERPLFFKDFGGRRGGSSADRRPSARTSRIATVDACFLRSSTFLCSPVGSRECKRI